MEIDSTTMYEVTFEQLIMTQKALLEYKALYIETKRELDRIIQENAIEFSE